MILLPLLQGSLLSLLPALGSDPEPPRFHLRWMPIDADDPGAALQVASSFGHFDALKDGETLELAAMRLEVELASLKKMNPGIVAESGRLLCLDRRHRCFPGETLEQIAKAHGTEVAVLRELNALEEEAEPAAWSSLRIPAILAEKKRGLCLNVASPAWAMKGGLPTEFRLVERRVEIGQDADWAKLAEEAGCSVEFLRRANGMEGDEALPAERAMMLRGYVLRESAQSFQERLLFAMHILGVDLPELLAANQVEEPAELEPIAEWSIPFVAPTGLRGVQVGWIPRKLARLPGVAGFGSNVVVGDPSRKELVYYLVDR